MVGEAEELVAAGGRGAGHLLDRRLAVRRPRRVAVHLAAEVAELDEPGSVAPPRRLELAAVLAQLGRDEAVAEEGIERLLVPEGMHLSGLDHRDAVLGDREPVALRLLAQRDVVVLRAGEVLQEVAVALRRHDAEIEPEALLGDHGRLRVAVGDDLEHPRQADEVRRQRRGVGGGRDHVEVAERLAAPARAARLGDVDRGGVGAAAPRRPRGRREAPCRGGRDAARPAPGRRRAPSAPSPPSSAPMPASVRSCCPSAAAFSSGERRDAELPPDARRRLRAEAGQPHERGHLARNLLAALRERLHVAGLDDLDDLRLDRLADVGELLRPAPERQLGDGRGGVADPRRGATVGGDAERLLAEDLGEVREQVEPVGEIAVPGKGRDHVPIIGPARRARLPDARASICLPTYNERENLEPMVRALGEQIDPDRDRVLVIDDNSPDGTGELADALAAELPWVEVLHRPAKDGLGPAYIAGFRRALADGSRARARDRLRLLPRPRRRAPADRRLRGRRRPRARLALGRRAAARSTGAAAGCSISRGGSFYARTILGVPRARPDGWVQVLPPRGARDDRLDAIAAKGYGFQIETTYRALRAGFRVVEIPITFTDRRVGESKMDGSIVVEAMLQVPALRWRALRGTACSTAPTYTGRMDEVTDATFDDEVLASEVARDRRVRGALVPAVQGDRAALAEIADGAGGRLRLVKLDIDANLRTPSRYGVLSVPTVILFAGGEPRETLVGAAGQEPLRAGVRPVSRRVTRALGRSPRGRGARVPHDRAVERGARRAAARGPRRRFAAALAAAGIDGLYAQQAEAWEAAARGENVIVTTAPPRGSRSRFNLPVLDAIAREPTTRALYLYPTKALTQDQARSLARLRLPGLRPAIYDGDTEPERRAQIREPRTSSSRTPTCSTSASSRTTTAGATRSTTCATWSSTRPTSTAGVFGSHVGNVLRRLRRLARAYGSEPQFLLASATIANPGELALALTGREATVVDVDTSARAERDVVLWNPAAARPGARRARELALARRRCSWPGSSRGGCARSASRRAARRRS